MTGQSLSPQPEPVLMVHRIPPGCPFCPHWPDDLPCEIDCEAKR